MTDRVELTLYFFVIFKLFIQDTSLHALTSANLIDMYVGNFDLEIKKLGSVCQEKVEN